MIALRAREYRPTTGRFLTMDPEFGNELEPSSLNRYIYANADPVNRWDPRGTEAAILYPHLVLLGAAVAAEGLALFTKKVKAYEIQEDFPPFTFRAESDPGKKDACVKAVLDGVLRCKKILSPKFKKICIAGVTALSLLRQAVNIFTNFPHV